MNISKKFTHNTVKNDYTVYIEGGQSLRIKVDQKYSFSYWQGQFSSQTIKQITFKTGNQLYLKQFIQILIKGFQQKQLSCYVDILTSQDLQNLRSKRSSHPSQKNQKKPSKSNKRYIILTYMINQNKYHYPLGLACKDIQVDVENMKTIYQELRVELEQVRTQVLNDTQSKTHNSFSIEYEKRNNGKQQAKVKEVDQIKSENQILKAKFLRLQQQAEKKKANIQIEAAIQRTKQLKDKLQTQNLQLVDWKNNISDQQFKQVELKKQMQQLHKKICKLLTTDKQVSAKKKGEQTQKQLNQVKNATKKNTVQLQRLKKQLEASKMRVKQYQLKAKKLTSQKNVMQKGSRKGPYSSGGSVRSYGSFNSSVTKKSNGTYNSSLSKPKSNYSYNSNKFR